MMSHRMTSTDTWPPPPGRGTVRLFFVIFVPSVATYRSSYSSRTYRRIRDVLPTAASPAMQSFSLTTSPAAQEHFQDGTRPIEAGDPSVPILQGRPVGLLEVPLDRFHLGEQVSRTAF